MSSHYIEKIKSSLQNSISELAENPMLFLRNPNKDFIRNRKINFETFVKITMQSSGGSMNKELLDYFDFSTTTPSVSAYNQQRAKVLPEAFEFLFHKFTDENLPPNSLYKGSKLIACDGSNLTITTNPNDPETCQKSNQFSNYSNHMHVNAFYDVIGRVYLDAIVQTLSERNEFRACAQMIDRSNITGDIILIADRGYENYNIFAHAIEKGWGFVIRAKDISSNGIASALTLPVIDTFDVDVSFVLGRSQKKSKMEKNYKFMPTVQTFDYVPVKSTDTYSMNLRIVRFEISENNYELLITNLDRTKFTSQELKEIYHLRWGIETSFRELKYSIGLTNFHAKKSDYIKQEIYARMLLYNYCELITGYVIQEGGIKNQKYQVNFTLAIYICREYLRNTRNISPPDIVMLINRNTLPVRLGRKDPRKVKPQSSVSFLYRVA